MNKLHVNQDTNDGIEIYYEKLKDKLKRMNGKLKGKILGWLIFNLLIIYSFIIIMYKL
jgi:hypothetical protein